MWRSWLFLVAVIWLVNGEEEFSGSLFDKLLEIDENQDDSTTTRRVTFSGGAKGMKKGDVVMSDAINDFLFGNNTAWLYHLKNHVEATDEDLFGESNRTKRAGIELKRGINFWPDGKIPYMIEKKHFNLEEQKELREAMDVYEEMTCLEFVPRTVEKQWIYLHHTDDGCYSYLGDARAYSPGPQPISLQNPGCRHFGTYLHELGHAVGLVHEHQLPTRDKYVRYYPTNIDPKNLDQLEMYNPRVVNTFNTPYDLGSIMHYGIISFSIDDISPTLGVDNPWLAQHIGRRYSNMLSYGDVKTINALYKCPAKRCTAQQMMGCPQGYVDKRCKCITPITYKRDFCRDTTGYEGFCQKMAAEGRCDVRFLDHHKTCARSCGFCPRFMPGETAIGIQQDKLGKMCVDRYHEPMMCQKWKGFCGSSPWMHRNCRRTCNACTSQFGDCANLDEDSICDRYKKTRQCTRSDPAFLEFVRARCPDSCGTCGARNMDLSCRNKISDAECAKYANEDACERMPLKMFVQCPSTCNRCYWNKGNCKDKANPTECVKMALANYCITGGAKHLEVKRMCQKTCDTCMSPSG